MEIETLNIMNDGIYFSLMIKVIMLIVVLLTIAGLVIYDCSVDVPTAGLTAEYR